MTMYRKIWTEHFGPIPKDEDGRTYEIHHIDGDRNNNDISNLKCVSIQEHYDIHYSQGDYWACRLISHKMSISPEETFFLISETSKKSNKERLENGTHHFLGSNINNKRVEDGTHPFLGGEIQKQSNAKRIENGTHNLLGGEVTKRRIADGTHQFVQWHNCPHCSRSGKGPTFIRYHFDNCKMKSSS